MEMPTRPTKSGGRTLLLRADLAFTILALHRCATPNYSGSIRKTRPDAGFDADLLKQVAGFFEFAADQFGFLALLGMSSA